MFWIILTVLFAIIAVGGLVVVPRVYRPETIGDAKLPDPRARYGRYAALAAIGLWIIITGFFAIKPVRSGEVGVVRQFGEIVGQEGEGLTVIAPWQTIDSTNIRTQRAQFENMTAASSETQDVFMTVTINYAVQADAVPELLRDVGANWFDVLVPSRVTNFTKAETAKYETVEIIPQRETIRRAVQTRLAEDLAPYGIIVSDLLIDNISFQAAFTEAIEQKQVAAENARAEQERTESIRAKAEQARVSAQGAADAAVIQAQGEAEANNLIAASLTPEVLQYLAITELADDIQIALIPSGEGIILDPGTLLAPSTTQPEDPPTTEAE